MLQIIKDMPGNILGITAKGKITAKDYETILMPAVKKKVKAHKKVRMLYQLGEDFTGFSMGAMMDDAKIGMKFLKAWERVAFVSDHELINTFAKFFGYLLPCKVRVFKNTDLEKAKVWISKK